MVSCGRDRKVRSCFDLWSCFWSSYVAHLVRRDDPCFSLKFQVTGRKYGTWNHIYLWSGCTGVARRCGWRQRRPCCRWCCNHVRYSNRGTIHQSRIVLRIVHVYRQTQQLQLRVREDKPSWQWHTIRHPSPSRRCRWVTCAGVSLSTWRRHMEGNYCSWLFWCMFLAHGSCWDWSAVTKYQKLSYRRETVRQLPT